MPRFYGDWIEHVPQGTTINDVARMIHAKLWAFPGRDTEDDAALRLPDFVLQETTVILCGADSELSLFDPRRQNITPYIDGARLFQPYVGSLPTIDGLPHVKAIVFRR